MRQVLVVANQTLGGDQLHRAIRDRLSEGPCSFFLVVPASRHAYRESSAEALSRHLGSGLPPDDETRGAEEADYEQARQRLARGLDELRELGAHVDGDVGDADPVRAIETSLMRQHCDEIILSTLPSGASRWLRQDLPSKLRRKFKVPITVVTPLHPANATTN